MSDIPPIGISQDIFWNLVDITKNNFSTIGSYKNILQNIIISPFPCNSSREITDIICGYNEHMSGFAQIRHLADSSRNLINRINEKIDVLKNMLMLKSNMKKIDEINKKHKDSFICSTSKFVTHGLCKVNEINNRIYNKGIWVGLIGSNIIPDKIKSALNSTNSIIDGELENDEIDRQLETIDENLEDISHVNDTMEDALESDDSQDSKDKKEKDKKEKDKSKAKKSVKKKQIKTRKPKNKSSRKAVGKSSRRSSRRSSRGRSKRGRRQRGGASLLDNIVDPITNSLISINSVRGKNILNNYASSIKI
tara:strand:- start:1786 stop:2709 length:924 start_codon:yes stop_codon:yes gene_type:complete